ncbi:unnamed protein product, partial [Peronospora destructor]
MRFWWPDWQPRERSLSLDSECSTTSHSSLASDASFYSAGAVAETGAADGFLGRDDPLGVGLPMVDPPAPVLDSDEPNQESSGAPRAAPYLGACGDWGGATSDTGVSPATPIAQAATARDDPSDSQAPTRSSSATLRRFEDRAADGRPPGQPIGTPDPPVLGWSIGDVPRVEDSASPTIGHDGLAHPILDL